MDCETVIGSKEKWKNWLVERALPLWGGAGFDEDIGLYRERLTFDGRPEPVSELRLMVQARQIATFCRAAVDGFVANADHALACLDNVTRLYHRPDGQPGWIFAIAPGSAVNPLRDLYAHAFILYAHAWAYCAGGDRRLLVAARSIVTDIALVFAHDGPGFAATYPATSRLRLQNPHMHLLEALLAMAEVSQDAWYLDHAREIVVLALDELIDRATGTLAEIFDCRWRPAAENGVVRVEPGHQFEWSWLLFEYLRLCNDDPREAEIRTAARRLHHFALAHGFDETREFLVDAISDGGVTLESSIRLWPQTEYLRLHAQLRTLRFEGSAVIFETMAQRILDKFAPADLEGGWIDRFDDQRKNMVKYMPASSLYHVYGYARLCGDKIQN